MNKKGSAAVVAIAVIAVIIICLIVGWYMRPRPSPSSSSLSLIYGAWGWNSSPYDGADIGIKNLATTTIEDSFQLKLLPGSSSQQIVGNYFASWAGGDHIDSCDTADDGSTTDCVTGTITGNTATISFYSSYAEETGTATLSYDPASDTLQWVVTQPPQDTYYAPASATLQRLAE